ncbi:MAG: stage sporulation protein [Clostridia bacterium]|nr:stage sporulation protein [Clostridia bacterium]
MAVVKLALKTQNGEAPQQDEVYNWEPVFGLLPSPLHSLIGSLPVEVLKNLEEIRLRRGRPLQVRWSGGEGWVAGGGGTTLDLGQARILQAGELQYALQALTRNSLYALEEELRLGYITIPGGHRVGLTGEAVVENGEVKTLKNITGLNIRLARSLTGCARPLLPFLSDGQNRPYNTLIISPPRCGKTTLLRDLVRSFSLGLPPLPGGFNVAVVDERSEIAGCYQGIPQLDVGPRTDVLDRCPKASGMLMLLRSMGPEIIATDEIGRPPDLEALQEVLNAGVAVLATVHAPDIEALSRRPGWAPLLAAGVWQRLIVLSRRSGPGTVEAVFDGAGGKIQKLYLHPQT